MPVDKPSCPPRQCWVTPALSRVSCVNRLIYNKLSSSLVAVVLVGSSACHHQTPIESIVVEVTGDDFNWHFHYPGIDGQFGTEDDMHSVRNLYLPDNASVTLKLHSNDYLYSLSIPDIDKQEIAVPDLEYVMQFKTSEKNTWELKGDQFCGFSHESLIGNVYVRNQYEDNFYDW